MGAILQYYGGAYRTMIKMRLLVFTSLKNIAGLSIMGQ